MQNSCLLILFPIKESMNSDSVCRQLSRTVWRTLNTARLRISQTT